MLNILAVHPEYPGGREVHYVPLGFGIVLAIARQGHQVKMIDLLNQRASRNDLENALRTGDYDVCMMSGFAMQVRAMREVTKIVRRLSPRTKVILGGVGISDIPEIALNYTGADAVAMGECERVLPDLFASIEANSAFEGVETFAFRHGDTIVQNKKGPVVNDLDCLPFAAYDLFDVEYISQRSYNGWGYRSAFLESSRGCPFLCDFCINSVLNDREMQQLIYKGPTQRNSSLRLRSTTSLAEEITYLKDTWGVNDIVFTDEEFMTQRQRVFEVCDALKPLGVTWMTSGRADWATVDKLKAMKDAGCRGIVFGVETGSQRMMDLMHKSAKKEKVVAGLASARTVGINFIANFMIAHPGETAETIEESVDFCREMDLMYLPSYTTLFPNSKMFHQNKDRVKSWEWYFDTLSHVQFTSHLFVNLTDLPDRALRALRNRAIARSAAYRLFGKERHRVANLVSPLLVVILRVAENLPGPLRFLLRNLVRRIFDLRNTQQIPPNDLAIVPLERAQDGYEESLALLEAQGARRSAER